MANSSLVGKTLKGRYEIIQRLGSGGFGDTYLAIDQDLPDYPKLVVKHLAPKHLKKEDFHFAKRLFEKEAKLLYRLGEQSDQIPRLYAYFEENEQFLLVQEFVEGHDLTEEIQIGSRMDEGATLSLLREILSVLSFVHQNGVIHRDIKPQNIMRRTSDGKLFLIDFGAVKEISVMQTDGQGQTSLTVGIGSPGFMPNEQANGRPKQSSDVYAVGMIGILCLTGMPPHQLDEDPQTGEMIWRQYAQVSESTAGFVNKMVRDHFRDRYPSAIVALEALETFYPSSVQKSSPVVEASTLPETVKAPSKGHPEPQHYPPPVTPSPISSPPAYTPARPDPANAIASPRKSRRSFLALLGLGGIGLGGTLLWGLSKNWLGTSSELSSLATNTFSFETVKLDESGTVVDQIMGSAKFFSEDLGEGVSLDMVLIPAGKFMMGSPSSELERADDERPQHEVSVPEFLMGKFEVTQAQWDAVMSNRSAKAALLMGTFDVSQAAPDATTDNPSNFKGANRPVERVTWDEAIEFCQRLSQQTGREYRLPSEAEWEYACRADTTTPFYFGEAITPEYVNFDGDWTYASAPKGTDRKQTTDVGSFPPNEFGLYDMHGNVWEWCQDTWHDNYDGAPLDGSSWIKGDDDRRLLRGGSWDFNPRDCRSANRYWFDPGVRYDSYGFRVVLSLPRNSLPSSL